MKVEEIIKYNSKFTNLEAAKRYCDRAFETTNSCLVVVMIDCPYYITVSHKNASILMKAGYELVNW